MTQARPAESIPSADDLRQALCAVIDPEVGTNIVDLGLVYGIAVEADLVRVTMTMTSPACPMGEMIVDEVAATLRQVLPAGVRTAVDLVWSPAWDPSMMTAKARRVFE